MHFKIETISALPTDFSYRKLRLRADRKSGVPVRQPPARCSTPFTGLSWHGSLTWLSLCCSISGVMDFLVEDGLQAQRVGRMIGLNDLHERGDLQMLKVGK